jgi:hypothetical protein
MDVQLVGGMRMGHAGMQQIVDRTCLNRMAFYMWSVVSTRGYINMRESLTSHFSFENVELLFVIFILA